MSTTRTHAKPLKRANLPNPRILFSALLLTFLWLAAPLHAEDPLDREVDYGYSYESFDEAIQQMQAKSGLKVRCPDELSKIMQAIPHMGSMLQAVDPKTGKAPQMSVRHYLDLICRSLTLKWTYLPQEDAISLDVGWRTEDPRSPRELLRYLSENQPRTESDDSWTKAFDALLSHPANINRAKRVRQTTSAFLGSPILVFIGPIVSANDREYTLVLLKDPLVTSFGFIPVSYYWFAENGTLHGSGYMASGPGFLTAATSANEKDGKGDQPKELHMILGTLGGGYTTVRFHLEKGGLKPFSMTDSHGDMFKDLNGVGASLLK